MTLGENALLRQQVGLASSPSGLEANEEPASFADKLPICPWRTLREKGRQNRLLEVGHARSENWRRPPKAILKRRNNRSKCPTRRWKSACARTGSRANAPGHAEEQGVGRIGRKVTGCSFDAHLARIELIRKSKRVVDDMRRCRGDHVRTMERSTGCLMPIESSDTAQWQGSPT